VTGESSGWTRWSGGECPVDPGAAVIVRHRSGLENPRRDSARRADGLRAGIWGWAHLGLPSDIIAYRLARP
jgi:hypothetical protein